MRNNLRKYRLYGNVSSRRRSGRPPKFSSRFKREVVRESERNRWKSAQKIASEFSSIPTRRISATSVKNILKSAGLHARVPVKRPLLKPTHIKSRKDWAKAHLNWTISEWNQVIFSDESKFCLRSSDGRTYVRRRGGEQLRPDFIDQRVKSGRAAIFVWDCISNFCCRRIVLIQETHDASFYKQILEHLMD